MYLSGLCHCVVAVLVMPKSLSVIGKSIKAPCFTFFLHVGYDCIMLYDFRVLDIFKDSCFRRVVYYVTFIIHTYITI